MKCTQVKKNFSHCTLYVCSARPKSFPVKCQGHVVLLQYIIIQSRTHLFFTLKKKENCIFPQFPQIFHQSNSSGPIWTTPFEENIRFILAFEANTTKIYCPIKLHISWKWFLEYFFCIFYRILEHSNFYPFVTLNLNIRFNEEGEHQYIFKKRVKFKYLKRGNHLKNIDL